MHFQWLQPLQNIDEIMCLYFKSRAERDKLTGIGKQKERKKEKEREGFKDNT